MMLEKTKIVANNLEKKGDRFLTISLLSVATILIIVALFANPVIKAIFLAWTVLP